MYKNWNDEEINIAIKMLDNGKTFKDIANILNKTQVSVTAKMNRLGYKSGYIAGGNKGKTKYYNYNWKQIQDDYNNNKLSYNEICVKFKLSSHALMWAKKHNKLILRSISDGLKLAWSKGKFQESNKVGIIRYRQLCEFKFNLNDYPDKFDFELIRKYGWYKAKNRGNVPNGVNRDHMYSIKDGFINNVDSLIISHPANCKLILHDDNLKKHSKSSITLDELKLRIRDFGLVVP